jgi:hypothetical protein
MDSGICLDDDNSISKEGSGKDAARRYSIPFAT